MFRISSFVLILLVNQIVLQTSNAAVIGIQKRFSPDTFQQEALTAHNKYRDQHCVGKMTLSEAVSKSAQDWANALASGKASGHDPNTPYGENLYTITGGSAPITGLNAADAVKSWYDEIKDFDFDKGGFDKKTGHFTQAVWKDSKALGIGYAIDKKNNKAYIVARYDPAGNYDGEYRDNVPKKCKS